MTVTRVSSYGAHMQTFQDTQRLQLNLAKLSNQISSGKKSTTFDGLGSDVEIYAGLQAKLGRSQKYIEQNALVENRLGGMDTAVKTIIEAAREMKGLILLRRNVSLGNDVELDVQGQGLLDTVIGQLNSSAEGRYLFAGSKTDTKPVDDPIPFGPPGVIDNGYYNGDDVDLQARINDSTVITYGIRANDPAFEKLISAFTTAIDGDNEIDPDYYMETAMDMITEALDDLEGVQANINSNLVKVYTATDQLENQQVYWERYAAEIVSTDIAEATAQVALHQAQLQASYQVFARVSSLNLADYLR